MSDTINMSKERWVELCSWRLEDYDPRLQALIAESIADYRSKVRKRRARRMAKRRCVVGLAPCQEG